MNQFRRAIATAFSTLQHVAGERVTYQCADGELILTTVPGRTLVAQENEYGVQRWQSRDFLFRVCELQIAGEAITPRAGDRIVTRCGQIYEVLSDGGAACFRHADPQHTLMRVHTKKPEAV